METDKNENRKIKVAVGLSGGVDSSVAALLLKEQGYDVFAIFMQNWHDTEGTLHGDCEWEEEKSVAEMVAKKIGIPFFFVDLSDIYRQRVVDYMFNEYEHGRTPNPDILCNREIKFDAFLNKAIELGADYVATGHYCIKEESNNMIALSENQQNNNLNLTMNEEREEKRRGNKSYKLIAGADKNKDQSYFLCQLSQAQLARALFPIGHLQKAEVRTIAKEAGLPSAEKKDSQGICFVGKVNLPLFLQQKLKPKEGNVVEIFASDYKKIATNENNRANYIEGISITERLDIEKMGIIPADGPQRRKLTDPYPTLPAEYGEVNIGILKKLSTPVKYSPSDGKIIGIHHGAQFYTIGQRRGLDIGGHKESLFIIAIDIEENTIYVGEGHSHPGLYRNALEIDAKEIHWIRPDLQMQPGEERDYMVRIRYRQPLQRARLYMETEGLYLLFEKPQRGVTPGQFAAWYNPETEELIGSGII